MFKYVITLLILLAIFAVILFVDVDSTIWNAMIPLLLGGVVIFAGIKGSTLEQNN